MSEPDSTAAGQEINGLAVWQALASDPTTGVSIIDDHGKLVYINEQAVEIFLKPGMTVAEAVGKPLDELYPAEFAGERKRVVHHVVTHDQPVVFRAIWKGFQHLSWIYPVHDEADDPTGKALVIGRRADADIRVNEPTMSGLHARIFSSDEGVRIRDLDSLNGTHVNGDRIVETDLRPGDQIKIGRAMIVVSGPTETLADPDSTEFEDVLAAVARHRDHLGEEGLAARRRRMRLGQVQRTVLELLAESLWGEEALDPTLLARLDAGETPYDVALQTRDEILKHPERGAR